MNLSRSQIGRLADEHIRHFERLLSRGTNGDTSVRLDECLDYIRIWQDVRQDNSRLERRFSEAGQQEIMDAVLSGEYDTMLGIDGENFEFDWSPDQGAT